MSVGLLEKKSVAVNDACILIVEDNAANLVLMARLLTFMGVGRCEWKTSGSQVVAFAASLARVDLILSDIHLPYQDGYSLLRQLRLHPRLKTVPVCAVTADYSPEQTRRAREAGFNGLLGKPLRPDQLPDQIRLLLAGENVWQT